MKRDLKVEDNTNRITINKINQSNTIGAILLTILGIVDIIAIIILALKAISIIYNAQNRQKPTPYNANTLPSSTPSTPTIVPPTKTERAEVVITKIIQPTTETEEQAKETPFPTPTSVRSPNINIPSARVLAHPALRLRAGPGPEYDIIDSYPTNSIVYILGRNIDSSWFFVRTKDNRQGWMAASYLDLPTKLAGVPLVPIPPTPAPRVIVRAPTSPAPMPPAPPPVPPPPTPRRQPGEIPTIRVDIPTPTPLPPPTPTPKPTPTPRQTVYIWGHFVIEENGKPIGFTKGRIELWSRGQRVRETTPAWGDGTYFFDNLEPFRNYQVVAVAMRGYVFVTPQVWNQQYVTAQYRLDNVPPGRHGPFEFRIRRQ